MSEAKVKVTDISNGTVVWEGSVAEARKAKSLSRELVRMIDQTGIDGVQRMKAGWKSEKV